MTDATHPAPDPQVRVGVYALVAGLASVVPIPLLDSVLGSLARGAALRRVAERHGVTLTAEARRILSTPGVKGSESAFPLQLVRGIAVQFVAPFRVIKRFEEGVTALGAAQLLDYYLRTRPAESKSLSQNEAISIRQAIDNAVVSGAVRSAWHFPSGVYYGLSDGIRAAFADEASERNALERLVDTWLDALADIPDHIRQEMEERFDAALAAHRSRQ